MRQHVDPEPARYCLPGRGVEGLGGEPGGGKGAEGNSARGGVDVVGIELARLDPRQEPLGAGEVLAPAGARVRQRARHPELVRSIDAILVETTGRSYGRVFAAEPVIRILER